MSDSSSTPLSLIRPGAWTLRNQTVLVTGGAGFIGTNLVQALARNNRVIALDEVNGAAPHARVGDVTDPAWFEAVGPVDIIFHLAAIVGVDQVAYRPIETMNTEIFGINRIIEYARQYAPRKIIYTSSSAVYGDVQSQDATAETARTAPLSTYGLAKLLAEAYLEENCRLQGTAYTVARIFNAFGPHQDRKMVVSRFIQQAISGEPLMVFDPGTQTRDFTCVDDVVAMLIQLANPALEPGIFNIGTGQMTSLMDVARLVIAATQSSSPIHLAPLPANRRKFEVRSRICNPAKIEATLGFRNWTPLAHGLRHTIEHYRQRPASG